MPEDIRGLSYLDWMTSALPYHLRKPDKVAILGVGGGQDILQARYHGVRSITGVELNPQFVELLGVRYGQFSGNLLSAPGVTVHIGDMRGFMEQSLEKFDLIHLALVDAFSPSASGLYALSEDYLYTVEALQEYIRHLSPHGFLSITRWIKNPPRDSLKLMATAVTALRQSGIDDVGHHLALVRGWQTSTLLVKASGFTETEVVRIEEFCQARSFDVAYTFAAREDQTNRYNILAEPIFFQAARALVGEDFAAFIADYKYNLEPATDNRPYFHHFFRWKALREVVELKAMGGAALLEAGYVILLTVILVAAVLSIVLIMTPLILFRGASLGRPGPISKLRVFLYFSAIGIGYLFIEIAFIQKFVLFLHHPVYAISASVAAFLVFSGIGSLLAQQWSTLLPAAKLIRLVAAGIGLISLCYLIWLGKWFALAADLSFSSRLLLTALLIAPLGILMGMPFSLALDSLATHAAGLIPWAWGINGCGSVIGSMLATFLAIHAGFAGVIVVAVFLYLGIVFCFPGPSNTRIGPV
jgi:spermidine synthase